MKMKFKSIIDLCATFRAPRGASACRRSPASRLAGAAKDSRWNHQNEREPVRPGGLEPPTCGLGNRCSVQLSYRDINIPTPQKNGGNEGTRTPKTLRDRQVRVSSFATFPF